MQVFLFLYFCLTPVETGGLFLITNKFRVRGNMHITTTKVETNLLESLQPVIQGFSPVSLEAMDKVAFMDRFDRKFVFHTSQLPLILQKVQPKYSVLQIDHHRFFEYSTLYYDTSGYEMYLWHHNRKLSRMKVRKREYLTTGQLFFEIKKKNNKGKTRKKRITTDNLHKTLSKEEKQFVCRQTPFNPENLEPKLTNRFTRITLTNKGFPERITIDFNVRYRMNSQSAVLHNIAIVEIKMDAGSSKSEIEKILLESGLSPMKFSKYCIGSVLLDKKLKYNRFKTKLITLQNISNDGKFASVH